MSAPDATGAAQAEAAREELRKRWPLLHRWLAPNGGESRRYPRLAPRSHTPNGRRSRTRSIWLARSNTVAASAQVASQPASEPDDNEAVEVAHEALIRHWPRLREWLDQDRAALLLRESVREAAQEWDRHHRDESYLTHRGRRLDEAQALRHHPRLRLNPLEFDYLGASLALREREEQEREAQRLRELAAERERAELAEAARREAERRVAEQAVAARGLRRRLQIAAVLGMLALLAAGYAFYNFREAGQQRAAADEQRVLAEERGAAAEAAAGTAEAERARADQQAAAAETERAAAVAAAATAAAESRRADLARTESDRQATIARARALAAEARRQHAFGQDERGALLARQGYLFSQASGEPMQAQNDEALRAVLGVNNFSRVLADSPNWAIAVSPDGRTLATAGMRSGVLLRDLSQPDAPPVALDAPAGAGFVSLAFSPDGRTLAAGPSSANEGGIHLWDLDHPNAAARMLRGHEQAVSSLEFTSDGAMLASGSHDGTIRLWDLDDPTSPTVLRGHTDAVRSIAINNDGSRLASGSHDQTIRIWNLQQPDLAPEVLEGHSSWVVSVDFAPEGLRLASASFDDSIRLWDVEDSEASPVVIAEDLVDLVAFSPDGQSLATGGSDGTIRLRDARQPDAEPIVLTGHEGGVDFVFTPDGGRLASTGVDATVRVWDLGTPISAPTRLLGFTGPVTSLAVTSDGATLAAGGWRSEVNLWNLRDPAPPQRSLAGTGIEAVAISPDDTILATGARDGTVRLWDLDDLDAPPMVREFDGMVQALAFSPDGSKLAAAGVNQSQLILLWDLTRPTAPATQLNGLDSAAHAVAFSADGAQLAVGGEYGRILLWDLRMSNAPKRSLPGQPGQVYAVAFTPDGTTLLAGGCGIKEITENRECPAGEIRLFDLDRLDADPIILSGFQGAVYALDMSPDGATVAAACGDGMVRLWDLRQVDAPPVVLAGAASEVRAVAFTSDGRTVAAGERDGTVWLWPASTATLADMVCAQTWRNLTRLEWDQYVGTGVEYERTCPDLPAGEGAPAAEGGLKEPVAAITGNGALGAAALSTRPSPSLRAA